LERIVNQGFRIFKHFPKNRFSVSRGSSFEQPHRDYFSISGRVLGLNNADTLLSSL
jgi:hypothetical protein